MKNRVIIYLLFLCSCAWQDNDGLKIETSIDGNFKISLDTVNNLRSGYMLTYSRLNGLSDIVVDKCIKIIHFKDGIFVKSVGVGRSFNFNEIQFESEGISSKLGYTILDIDSSIFLKKLIDPQILNIFEYPYPVETSHSSSLTEE